MVTFTQSILQLFACHLAIVMQCVQCAHEFLIAFSLLSPLHDVRLYQMLGKPLTVAQTQSAQHVKYIFKRKSGVHTILLWHSKTSERKSTLFRGNSQINKTVICYQT